MSSSFELDPALYSRGVREGKRVYELVSTEELRTPSQL
jgi:hypothetical protein